MSESYVSCHIQGGLGNQLFQIATAIDYSKKHKKSLIFFNDKNYPKSHGFQRNTYWKTLFQNKLQVFPIDQVNHFNFQSVREKQEFVHNDLPNVNGNVMLLGYFQSYKYLSNELRKEMQDLVFSNATYMHTAYDRYNQIKKEMSSDKDDDYVSVHVRRTDYVILQHFHGVMNQSYYEKAYDIVCNSSDGKLNKKKIVVFSDDIEWCKENFRIGENDIYFVDEKNECIELILMTFFTHNILANSTFSWWGSYLSNSKNKTVIAPSQWFQKDGPSQWKEIYNPDWIVV